MAKKNKKLKHTNKSSKKAKKLVDPNEPRKPTSAYFFFQMVRRNQVKQEKPSFSNTEVVVQLGKDWNNLTDIQKLVFEKLSEADRKRYEKEINIYKSINTNVIQSNTTNQNINPSVLNSKDINDQNNKLEVNNNTENNVL